MVARARGEAIRLQQCNTPLNEAEDAALRALALRHGVSRQSVIRSALAIYQHIIEVQAVREAYERAVHMYIGPKKLEPGNAT